MRYGWVERVVTPNFNAIVRLRLEVGCDEVGPLGGDPRSQG
jgi:hypothetical protein